MTWNTTTCTNLTPSALGALHNEQPPRHLPQQHSRGRPQHGRRALRPPPDLRVRLARKHAKRDGLSEEVALEQRQPAQTLGEEQPQPEPQHKQLGAPEGLVVLVREADPHDPGQGLGRRRPLRLVALQPVAQLRGARAVSPLGAERWPAAALCVA
eukprot:scaffold28864_cov62-Phaeocystis_antarctica.AAC.3